MSWIFKISNKVTLIFGTCYGIIYWLYTTGPKQAKTCFVDPCGQFPRVSRKFLTQNTLNDPEWPWVPIFYRIIWPQQKTIIFNSFYLEKKNQSRTSAESVSWIVERSDWDEDDSSILSEIRGRTLVLIWTPYRTLIGAPYNPANKAKQKWIANKSF